MNRFVFILALLFAGCAVPAASQKHIDTQTAAHDGATRLIDATLKGELKDAAAADNITQKDIDKTPPRVRRLLNRTIRFVYESRESWHTLKFTLDDGPDPKDLKLGDAPKLPAASDPLGGQ